MKTIAITTVAWVATIRSFVDGDIFRESNIDLSMGDVADRLGYLKAQDLLSGKLAGDQSWTGDNEFITSAGNGFEVSGDQNVVLSGTVGLVGTFASFSGAVVSSDTTIGVSGERITATKLFLPNDATLADAAATIGSTVANVPVITANRIYTLPTVDDGRIVFFRRPGTAAFTATLQDPTGPTTLGVIPSGQAGWIVAQARSGTGDWVPLMWSGNVTGILATV